MNTLLTAFTFPREYLQAALLVSLLSVWVLVVLFFYLNRYTRRSYFTAWTAAWLCYALWLTLNLQFRGEIRPHFAFSLAQCCVAASSVFLFWGSLLFLKLPVNRNLLGLFMLFVLVWSLTAPQLAIASLQVELPVFLLIGAGSMFAATCFFRFRRQMPFVGAGMLTLGFLLWGIYLICYPLSRQYEQLFNAGFFMAAVIQLFIAVSMVVLVLEEGRMISQEALEQIAAMNAEKESLQLQVITAEEKCQNLYEQVRANAGRQKAYAELRATQALIVQQERLRATGQMTSGLVHDLNNLLTPIKGYAEMLLGARVPLPDGQRVMVERIARAADDIARIVRRMRDFYRPRTHDDRVEPVDVNLAIKEVVDLTRPRWRDLPQQHGVAIQIKCELDASLQPLASDASELRQALTNLIFNAVDAMPNGGMITIATQAQQRAAAGAAAPPAPAVQIEVRDQGVGMDEETRKRCLEPFFSTKTQRGGTGLGLAMVYGMVQRQRGEITVESAPGAGSCIRLVLPLVEAPPPGPLPTRVTAVGPMTNLHLRVLYLDDEPMVRGVIGDGLRSFQHEVIIASSGDSALQMFHYAMQTPKPFDAVITDLGMPNMNGMDFARAIKTRAPATPVIMLTGWNTRTMTESGHDRSVDAVLAKPVSLANLNATLLRVAGVVRPPAVG